MMKMQWLSALVLGALSCAAFAEEAPADNNLIQQGEYLARAGDCVACHTNGKEETFCRRHGDGDAIGTIYSTNITPDSVHGIGGYTFEEFDDAVRKGFARMAQPLSGDAVPVIRSGERGGYARDVRLLYAWVAPVVRRIAIAISRGRCQCAGRWRSGAGSSLRRRLILSRIRRSTRCWNAGAIWSRARSLWGLPHAAQPDDAGKSA